MGTAAEVVATIRAGDLQKLQTLLASNRSLAAARDEGGVSVLMLSLYHRHREMAEFIAAAKPFLDIFESASMGRAERLRELLEQDPKLVNAWSPDGFTPLGLACFFGREEAARELVARGAEVAATAKNAMKVQPLHAAAASGRAALVKLLLEHGAPPDARQQMGWTALHEAARNGNAEMAQALLAHGADPNLANDEGKTAAMLAEAQGHRQILELLPRT